MVTRSRPQGERPRRWLGWCGGRQRWRAWPREPEGKENQRRHTRPVPPTRSHTANGGRDGPGPPEPCPRWSPMHGFRRPSAAGTKAGLTAAGRPAPQTATHGREACCGAVTRFCRMPGGKTGHGGRGGGDRGGRGGRFYGQVGGSGLMLSVGAQWALRMSLNLRCRATEMTRCHSKTKTC